MFRLSGSQPGKNAGVVAQPIPEQLPGYRDGIAMTHNRSLTQSDILDAFGITGEKRVHLLADAAMAQVRKRQQEFFVREMLESYRQYWIFACRQCVRDHVNLPFEEPHTCKKRSEG
jgi:hypothetical protein